MKNSHLPPFRGNIVTTPSMAPRQVEDIVMLLARTPHLLAQTRENFQSGAFRGEAERGAEMLWIAASSLYKTAGALAPFRFVFGELDAMAGADKDAYPVYVHAQAVALAQAADALTLDEISALERWVKEHVTRLLSARTVMDALNRTLQGSSRVGYVEDPAGLLTSAANAISSIGAIRGESAVGMIPSQGRMALPDYIPTGVTFVDRILGGGTEAGKVYGLLGPFGSFKTGFALQLCVADAANQRAMALRDPSYKPGVAVYAVYEGGRDDIQLRASACASEIPKPRLRDYYAGRAGLCETVQGVDYEAAYGFQTSEAARFRYAGEVDRYFRIQDMCGTESNPGAGSGYIEELVGALDRVVRDTGMRISSVFVDYAKLMARRHLMAKGLNVDRMLRHYVGGLPDMLRNQITNRFKCSCWVLQQLNTESNRRPAGHVQHHAWSSEAGDFAENVWYAFCLSAVDKTRRHAVTLNASKTRDTAGESPIEVLRIDGVRSCLVPADDYTYDATSRGIVSKTAFAAVAAVPIVRFDSEE